jgi:hypothetical protein
MNAYLLTGLEPLSELVHEFVEGFTIRRNGTIPQGIRDEAHAELLSHWTFVSQTEFARLPRLNRGDDGLDARHVKALKIVF